MFARLVEIVLWGAVLTGLTVVFISAVSPVEMVVAATAGLGGAFAARRMRMAAGVHAVGGSAALRALVALPHAVLRGLAVLVAAAAADPTDGAVRRIRLRPGAAASWAAVLIAASPDTCVIDVPGDAEVVVHALRPGSGPVEEAVAGKDTER
ncbi:hypothetical protein ACFC1T_17845 [Kitasatospora sp. NPDC056076]|uniref:hypothetical protein n=1 Tax=Kitasatospora sp. NPDC056076 TaxID=3345703 RepID=UPI0035DE3881